MNNLQIFSNETFGEIRMMMVDGEPWFVAKDVAVALGYAKPEKAVANHIAADDKGVSKMETPGGTQNMIITNESGLYSLILSSKLPKAAEFKHWVTSEVLPSIRKTGSYSTQNCVQFPPKATSAGEVASLIKNVRITMERQNSAPIKVARQTELLLRHFGIPVIEDFTETPSPWEQMSLINGEG